LDAFLPRDEGKSSPSHELTKAEGAERAIFEGSTELMRERDGPAANRFECGELDVELGVDAGLAPFR
jgi:hypothetical protein